MENNRKQDQGSPRTVEPEEEEENIIWWEG
jgi:hypothetical protein